jgi:hypothetical protein
MKILTIQSDNLDVSKRIFADASKCNHPDALEVYKRLFNDYNQKKNTNYDSFFWGFSELRTNNLEKAIKRACEMIGTNQGKVMILEVPDSLCLETDFYNFCDEIFAHLYPEELESYWESIYEVRDCEKQVIFPYIEPSMILAVKRI